MFFARARRVYVSWVVLTGVLLCPAAGAWATAPSLYSQPAYESPVRADPGDLLFIPGDGFSTTGNDTVVYQSIADTTQPLTPPASVPASSTATSGTATIVSTNSAPYSLAVMLPSTMTTDQSYALWVVNSGGEWSNGIKINDARPFWVSPDTAYVTAQLASMPRTLKVVGRNLQPAPGGQTQVQLVGPTTYTLVAANDNDPTTAIERYVAQVSLPATLQEGTYTVQVSRDGVSWVPLSEPQTVTVLADPVAPTNFDVGDAAYGGCVADDSLDDTLCVVNAIAAAKANGGGTVTFGPGVWKIGSPTATGVSGGDGIVVKPYVSFRGAGAGVTTIESETTWNPGRSLFTLQGHNTIQGITFKDARTYSVGNDGTPPMIRLGVRDVNTSGYPGDPLTVSWVTITHNTFDKPYSAVAGGGLPLDHIFITYNEFGAFAADVNLGADPTYFTQQYHMEDTIIDFNTFKPGSYMNSSIGQGVFPTGFKGGRRFDFSGNSADGTSTQYLNSPTDPKGWRGGYFWSTDANSEYLLVSQNTGSCTGDKTGDGEFIMTDKSGRDWGLKAAQQVSAATSSTVTIPGPLVLQYPNNGLTLPGNFYVGHWIAVMDGPGRGQVRKITSYPTDASGAPVLPVTFTVTPAWDVVPQATSRVTVLREYWQMYIVDNTVDQRQPLCTKANTTEAQGGYIEFYSTTADSVIEGNKQYDTNGVRVATGYSENTSSSTQSQALSILSAVDIRGNTITGEFDWQSECSQGGIQVWTGAATSGNPTPPLSYGLTIAHNTITHADGRWGGAIALPLASTSGPAPGNWDLTEGTLIFGNEIDSVSGAPPTAPTAVDQPLPYATSPYFPGCFVDRQPRTGVAVSAANDGNTVLAGNSCNTVTRKLWDVGTGTKKACPASPPANSCECP